MPRPPKKKGENKKAERGPSVTAPPPRGGVHGSMSILASPGLRWRERRHAVLLVVLNYRGKIYTTQKLTVRTLFKCTVQRHQAHSHCCANLILSLPQNFLIFSNGNSAPFGTHSPSPAPAPGRLHPVSEFNSSRDLTGEGSRGVCPPESGFLHSASCRAGPSLPQQVSESLSF